MGVLDSATLLLQAKNYSGSGDWLDESGNGHDFTPYGSPAVSVDADGSYFSLDGSTQYFEGTIHSDFYHDQGEDCTYLVRYADSNEGLTTVLFGAKRAAETGAILYSYQGDVLRPYWEDDLGNVDDCLSPDGGDKGDTFTGAFVRNTSADTLTAYIDGATGTPVTDPTTTDSEPAINPTIGARGSDFGSKFTGKIYAVAMWRRALSPAELVMAQEELEGTTRSLMDRAVLKLQAKNHSGSGDWLDESGFSHDATPSGATFLAHDGEQYLWLPGASGNHVTLSDIAAYDATDTMRLEARIAIDDVIGAADDQAFMSVWPGQFLFRLENTSGKLELYTGAGGASNRALSSSAISAGDGAKVWVRADVSGINAGAGAGTITFYESLTDTNDKDSVSWSLISTHPTKTIATIAPAASYEIGSQGGGTDDLFAGGFYRAIAVHDGSIEIDADFTDTAALVEPFATFTEKSANAATVTINRAASGYVSTVVDRDMWLLDGVDDYLLVADHADLNFGISDDLTLMVIARDQGLAVDGDEPVSKRAAGSGLGYYFNYRAATNFRGHIGDGTAIPYDVSPTHTQGDLFTAAMVRNTTDDDVEAFMDGVGSGSPVTDSTTGTLSNATDFYIGRRAYTGAGYWPGVIVAVVLWREALTDAEIASAGEALLQSWDGTWDGEILATVKNHLSVTEGGELLAVLQAQGATSKETVGALNELNGTTGVGFQKALRTYLGVT